MGNWGAPFLEWPNFISWKIWSNFPCEPRGLVLVLVLQLKHGYRPLSVAHRIDLHSQGFTMFCKIRKVALHRGRELCGVRQAWLGLTLTSCLLTLWLWTRSLKTHVLFLHWGGQRLRGGAGEGVRVPALISRPCVFPLAAAAWTGAVSPEHLLPASLTEHPPHCSLRLQPPIVTQERFFPPCGWPESPSLCFL